MVYNNLHSIQWRVDLEQALQQPPKPLQAIEYRRQWRTKSQPFLLECEDNHDYVVKTLDYGGRQLINDQLVARLGILLTAPVGQPELILIPSELINAEYRLQNIQTGLAHGCQWIPNCIDEWNLIATSQPENRLRLVLLATLYGWTMANDHQFLFHRDPPRLIYSVDHGHFFPSPPNWQINDLINSPVAKLDQFFSDCHFTVDELRQAATKLRAISEIQIIQTVASIPVDWSLTIEERIVMINFLVNRQQEILSSIQSVEQA